MARANIDATLMPIARMTKTWAVEYSQISRHRKVLTQCPKLPALFTRGRGRSRAVVTPTGSKASGGSNEESHRSHHNGRDLTCSTTMPRPSQTISRSRP